jgi:hypothetical protein
MPASVSNQRFSQWLQRILGLRESTALDVVDQLIPVLPVIDPTGREFALYRGDHYYAAIRSVANGGAGTFAAVSIQLPTAAGKIAVIDEIRPFLDVGVASGVVEYHSERGLVTGGAGPATGLALDGRNAAPSAVLITSGTPAAPPGVFIAQAGIGAPAAADTFLKPWDWLRGWVLIPNSALRVTVAIAATDLNVMVLWHERATDGSELRTQ